MTQQNRPFAIPFHSGDGLGCNYYRIPALITTQQGVTLPQWTPLRRPA